jgi:hypothetical protein
VKEKLYLLALPAADGMQITRTKPKYSKTIVKSEKIKNSK